VALILLPKSDRINPAKVAIDHVHSSAIRHSTTNSKYVTSRFCLATGLVNQKGTVDVCMVCVCFCPSWMEIRPNVVGKALGEPLTRITGPPMAALLLNERVSMSDELVSMRGEPASTSSWTKEHFFLNIVATWIKYYFHVANVFDDVMKTSHHIRWTFHSFSKKISWNCVDGLAHGHCN
jgi:hypothetical protein